MGLIVRKYDASLNFLATVGYDTPATETCHASMMVGGSTLVVVGSSDSGATEDWKIFEYDTSLALISSRTYDSGTSDRPFAVARGTGTYMYVSGISYTSPFGAYRTIRMNVTGTSSGGAGPAAPSAFAGTAQSTSSILYSWTDNSADEDGFRVRTAGGESLSGDLPAGTTWWLQTGLAVNSSTGSVLAQAFNGSGAADSAPLTRYTQASVPAGLAAAPVHQTSATISWSGSASTYQLERSTGFGFVAVSSGAATLSAETGLAGGSTYHYRVLGYNGDGIATAYASSITVITLPLVVASSPAAPSGFAGTALSTFSIQWSWTDNSSNETGFRVMSASGSLSGNLAANATTWTQTGLTVNASTGPLFVQAFNSTGTADSASASRFTLTSMPAGLAASNVFQTSVTVSWTGAGSTYQVERSTGASFAILSTGPAASYGDAALSAGSTYFYRVLAYNGDGLATAYASSITAITAPTPLPNAPTGFAGTAVSTSSILWSWTETATNELGYRVMSGLASLSGNLPADTTSWLQTGLAVNASTGPLHVQGFNAAGSVNSSTATRATMAAVPAGLAAVGVQQTSVTVNWTANGNPAGTVYELERSTGPGYLALVSTTSLSYFDGYLTPAVTHYYRIRAANVEAVASAYASSIAVVALPPPALPGIAGTPAGTALGTSSVTWTWVLASGATNHYLFRAADNAYLGSSTSGPFVQTALSPNVPYGLRAAGVNVGGTGPLSPSATVYTLATVPSAVASTAIGYSSLTVTWSLNGSAAGTTAQVERSPDAVTYSTKAAGALTSYADADLLGCTTYHYRVRHVNGDGFATAYATHAALTANTVPAPPAGLTAAANAGGTVGLAWGASPTEGVTGYRLFWDSGSGTVSYAAPIATLSSGTLSWTSGVLASSAAYTFALRTAHRCGLVETTGALAMSGAAAAAPALRAAIKEPDSGKRLHGNRVTILGELIHGVPADAQQLLFQFKAAAATSWTNVPAANVNHSNPDLSFPYYVHWNVDLLAPGDYDLRAVAYDRGGVPDAAPPAVRVAIVAAAVNADIDENAVGGSISKNQTIANGVSSVVDAAGAGASDPSVRVVIPAGAVTAATATVTVIANPVITTAAPSGFNLVGSAIKIDLSNGQTALNGAATISLTYPETIVFPSLLQIYYLNEATGQWSRDFTSTVNTTSRTVTGATPHFSTFALLIGTAFAPNLDSVQVYPVPFKPNGGNADEGRPFSAGDANSGIIFANLAMGSEIKIYTITGRLVASLDNAPITGTIRWDARNQDGRDAASGAYFAVIKAAGQKTVVKKLVIIR
ncbi:MAG: hypothetical protein M0D55_09910 [Elusimicrobiota bacterium]|nr:MAG: hypothetical protein M0D55_09910 [Elusimicrobiota bacterium]